MPTRPVELSPVFRLELEFAKPLALPSLSGERGFLQVASGRVAGDRLNGAIADDGGDWIVFRPDGVVEVESRMTIRTDDDQLVYLRSRGVLRLSPADFDVFRESGTFDGGQGYYRTTPYFDASLGKYDWLTRSVFLGAGTLSSTRSIVDVFEVD